MTKQESMTATELKTYILNVSTFAKRYNMQLADLTLFDITIEKMPEIEDKLMNLKNKQGINVEDLISTYELQTLFSYLSKVINSYHKKFSVIASKILYEKGAKQVFYVDFTIKKDYARKVVMLNKENFQKIAILDNAYFLNIETVSKILDIKQDDLQLLIDRSITYWTENFKNKK